MTPSDTPTSQAKQNDANTATIIDDGRRQDQPVNQPRPTPTLLKHDFDSWESIYRDLAGSHELGSNDRNRHDRIRIVADSDSKKNNNRARVYDMYGSNSFGSDSESSTSLDESDVTEDENELSDFEDPGIDYGCVDSKDMSGDDIHEQISDKRDDVILQTKLADFMDKPGCQILKIDGLRLSEFPEIMRTIDVNEVTASMCRLTTLKNTPFTAKILDVSDNNIGDLADVPESVTSLNISGNNLSSLNGIERLKSLETLIAPRNLYSDVRNLPDTLVVLDISCIDHISCKDIAHLKKLKTLRMDRATIDHFNYIPDSVEVLYIPRTTVRYGVISKLPKSITKFVAYGARLISIEMETFPDSLVHLDLYENLLTSIPFLPQKMKYIDISRNNILSLKNIPIELQHLKCTENPKLTLTQEQIAEINAHKEKAGDKIQISDKVLNCEQQGQSSMQGNIQSNNIQPVPHMPSDGKPRTINFRENFVNQGGLTRPEIIFGHPNNRDTNLNNRVFDQSNGTQEIQGRRSQNRQQSSMTHLLQPLPGFIKSDGFVPSSRNQIVLANTYKIGDFAE
jgi:hypothetical protein